MSTKKKTLSIELSDEIIAELSDIVKHLGIESPETLIKNYIREVIIAARIEQAIAATRTGVISKSTDLDFLSPAQK